MLHVDDTHTSLFAGRHSGRHWPWQHRRRLSLRRKDRVRPDSPRRGRHDGFRRRALLPGSFVDRGGTHLALLGFFGGIFAVPVGRADPAPAAPRTKRRRNRRRESCVVHRHRAFVGRVLPFHRCFPSDTRGHFPRWRDSHSRHHRLFDLLAPRFPAAICPVDRHAFDLPDPRGRTRKYSRARRRAARLQSHVVRRRESAARVGRAADTVPDVQGHLRPAVRETVRQADGRDPDFLRAAAARNAPRVARRERCDPQWRARLHFRRRTNHAHRPDASLPPRHGAHRQGHRRAHHPDQSRRRLGQHFQLRSRAFPLEAAALDSLSRHNQFRQADAAHRDALRGAPRRAGVAERGVHPPQEASAHAASLADSHRARQPLPLRHGRPPPAAHELGQRAAQRDFPRAAAEQYLGRAGNGRYPAAAFGAGRACELRRDAGGKSSGEFELHDFGRGARIVRRAVQARNRHHHKGAARSHSAESPRQDDPDRGGGRRVRASANESPRCYSGSFRARGSSAR